MSKKPVFEENINLIWHVINTRFGKGRNEHEIGHTRNDLFQCGSIGLLKAIKYYNPKKYDVEFSTYAVPMIWGEILRELRDTGYEVKAPRKSREIFNKIKNREVLPTIREIVEEFNTNDEYARLALELTGLSFMSMDKPLHVNNSREPIYLHEIIEDDCNIEEIAISNIELNKRLSVLDERERLIFDLTVREIPQREIGKIVGCSQVQVSRILKKAIDKAKNYQEVVPA